MKLVVGLGNPGKKYEGTRHNVGFEAVARLARECGATAPRKKFDGEVCECPLGGEKALLLAPQTFMNRSGSSVRQALDFYQVAYEDLLVICDEFQLPVGQVRLKPQGSDGGQNGLADVIRALGTKEFPRLRIGIGPVPDRWNPADFVLGKFTAGEREIIDVEIARAADAVKLWASEGLAPAMNKYNGKV
ncbi:MAG TPA: aminoacyl-tRNA hydrolase [Lacipirellulaceae bacterium]|nr:aminoacyl-tRNA hydrolase [Lacipirellulaceae bacterium]